MFSVVSLKRLINLYSVRVNVTRKKKIERVLKSNINKCDITWNTVKATQVNGLDKLRSPILNMSMPHVSISPKYVPNAFSCGVSTPYVGNRSPVKEFVCDNGRLTPDIWDIGGPPPAPRGERLRCWACWVAISFSSMRNDGKSNSCCLSAKEKCKDSD